MLRELMPHQIGALNHLSDCFSRDLGGVLFLEMRLGKTLVVIRHLESHDRFKERPILVVCPNSVKGTWGSELEEERIDDYLIVQGTREERQASLEAGTYRYVIANYEAAERLELHLYEWSAVVLDESLSIANPKAKRSEYFMNKFLPIKYKFVLCGMPAPETELQYFNQLSFVYGSFVGCRSYWQFRYKYFYLRQFKWFPNPGFKKTLYQELRKAAYILTRADAGIGGKKLYQKIRIPITEDQRRAYNEMLNHFSADGIETKYSTAKYIFLHQIAGGVRLTKDGWHSKEKFNAVVDLLNEELTGQSVVIWFRYLHEVNEMKKILDDNSIPSLLITGKVTPIEREILRGKFKRGEIKIALMTIKAMRTGTDWSRATTAIYFSNEFSWDLRAQSEDRIIHPQEREPKLLIDLCTDRTVDFDIVELLRGKKIDSQFFMSSLYQRVLERGMA